MKISYVQIYKWFVAIDLIYYKNRASIKFLIIIRSLIAVFWLMDLFSLYIKYTLWVFHVDSLTESTLAVLPPVYKCLPLLLANPYSPYRFILLNSLLTCFSRLNVYYNLLTQVYSCISSSFVSSWTLWASFNVSWTLPL